MANRETLVEITPEVLLKAYACGIFPMAESAEDPALYWVEPDERGIMPLDRFHVPSRLARTVRSDRFEVRINHDFEAVLDGCAEPAPGRTRTWINARIRTLYRKLYDIGHCHSVEAYEDGVLVGGLYGVCARAARSSARACSTARATPRRWRWCIWWRGSTPAAFSCSTPSS